MPRLRASSVHWTPCTSRPATDEGKTATPGSGSANGDAEAEADGEARATGAVVGAGAGDGPSTPAATTPESSTTGTRRPTIRRTRRGRPLGPREAGWTIMARPTVRAARQAGCGSSVAGAVATVSR